MFRTIDWGRNRYKPMVMFAHTAAIGAVDLHEVIIRSRMGLIHPDPQSAQFSRHAWLECYRRPSNVEAIVMHLMAAPDRIEECEYVKQEWPRLRRVLKAELRNLPRDERSRKLGERYCNLVYRAHVRDVEKQLKGEKREIPENAAEWFEKSELVFFISVAVPCLLENGCWPAELLVKAWRGDFEALEKLLRLDPIIETEPRVADQLFQMKKSSPDRHRLLMQAKAKGRTKTITLADLKFSLGGLLYKWSREWEAILKGELMFELLPRYALPGRLAEVQRWIRRERKRQQRKSYGCALTAPAIRGLFDAVAYDTRRRPIKPGTQIRELADPDMPQGEEAVRKRLKRNTKQWPSLRKWDKNRAG